MDWSSFDIQDLLVVRMALDRLAAWKSDVPIDAKERAREMTGEIEGVLLERRKNAHHLDQ